MKGTEFFFSDLVIIDKLFIQEPKFFIDILKKKPNEKGDTANTIFDDNIGLAKKINEDLPDTISYNNSDEKAEFTGIHRRLEQKMSRGQIKIDSTLDLHGMNQEEAKDATINFVRMAKKNNLNIVLIIPVRVYQKIMQMMGIALVLHAVF